jgi:hypothetical protein
LNTVRVADITEKLKVIIKHKGWER